MASQPDWDNLLADDYPANSFPLMRSILRGLRALWRAKTGDGSEPSDNLKYLNFGDSTMYNRWRLGYTAAASRVTIEENTNTEVSPNFVIRWTLTNTTGAVTMTGALAIAGSLTGCTAMTMAGNIDMAGNNLTNVGSINVTVIDGVTISTHMSRHLPGGADALTNNVAPPAIGSASAAGAGSAVSNSSHTHEGVHQLDTNSSGVSQVKGDVNFVDGAYIDITKSGQNITVAFSKPGRVVGKTAADQATIAAEVDLTSLTGLSLSPATTVSTRTFEISGTLEVIGGTAACNVTVRAYNGPNGALSDGAGKKIMEHTHDIATGTGEAMLSFGPMHWTPAADADLKVGLSLQCSAGNATVKGTASRFCYVRVVEVFA